MIRCWKSRSIYPYGLFGRYNDIKCCVYLDLCKFGITCKDKSLKGMTLEEAYKKHGPQYDRLKQEQINNVV